MLDKTLIVVGLISLTHAAISAAQYRSFLRLTELQFTWIPADIILQAFISLLMTLYGVISWKAKFCDINQQDAYTNKDRDGFFSSNSFMIFSHRGRILRSTNTSRAID